MVHLENWVWGLVFVLALVVFLHAAFELTRRLLARFALRVCQMREARDGSFICELKRKLDGFASRSLLPRVLVLVGSFAVMTFVLVEHSAKL